MLRFLDSMLVASSALTIGSPAPPSDSMSRVPMIKHGTRFPPKKTSRVREAFACPFKAGRNLTNLNSVSSRFNAVQRHSHAPLAAMQVNRPSHFSLSRPGHVRSFLLLDSALSPESPHQSLSRPPLLPPSPSCEPQTQSGWGNEREIFSFSSFFPPLAAPFRLRFVSLCSFLSNPIAC